MLSSYGTPKYPGEPDERKNLAAYVIMLLGMTRGDNEAAERIARPELDDALQDARKLALTRLAAALSALIYEMNCYPRAALAMQATMDETRRAAYEIIEGVSSAMPTNALHLPANHYSTVHGIPTDRLDAARRDGRLPAKKVEGRWHYLDSRVRDLWPEDFLSEESR